VYIEYIPITQWYRYSPIPRLSLLKSEVSVEFGIDETLVSNLL